MHTSNPHHAKNLLSLPADIAESTWSGWQCIANTLHRQRCEALGTQSARWRHLLRWLAGNLVLVGLLYLLYRFSRF
ncbi:hypothetical protein [Aquitalea sp. USM4]|uniref:hypothetical protein n=1 Tax=Aquitalea sp. USM4 TaxID=1590041 RepID=UPI00103A0877|nr:hypothetical protein [Aquitalea sp. USM4]QBJ77305.1 hypothetical protein DKK66_03800 [Aquitalea sp. USM4]